MGRLVQGLLVALVLIALCTPLEATLGAKHLASRKKASLAKRQQSLEQSAKGKANSNANLNIDNNDGKKEVVKVMAKKKTVSFALHHEKKSEEQQASLLLLPSFFVSIAPIHSFIPIIFVSFSCHLMFI
jgi:hypothetical protein